MDSGALKQVEKGDQQQADEDPDGEITEIRIHDDPDCWDCGETERL
jgi:hypothetical protein